MVYGSYETAEAYREEILKLRREKNRLRAWVRRWRFHGRHTSLHRSPRMIEVDELEAALRGEMAPRRQ